MNNMNNQITCDICRDLIPLVRDGVASADSETAVREHIKDCKECSTLFDGKTVPTADSSKTLLKIKRRLSGIYLALMLLGIYFGLTLTAGQDMFYNCLIMPIAGAFGYLAFRWKALFTVPAVLLVLSIPANAAGLFADSEPFNILMSLSYAFIYSLFALAGIIIAMLLHFVFKKFDKKGD